ncbi:MAG: ribosome biogenesis GTPase Der [Chloroflexi bacterium]|nr:ribosome biogenesis GTPase Der [Chloroflexota bacterium]
MPKSLVAIVGRPNVGKSTLFNRIVGRPLAIVQNEPGTTRDRVYGEASWNSIDFAIVDTGGLELRPAEDMAQRVKEQVEAALEEADCIIFLVDARDGPTTTDQEIAQTVRQYSKPVVLAVNKADNEERRQSAPLFYELGIGEPLPISAYHNQDIDLLLNRVVDGLPRFEPEGPREEVLTIAIVGRPNVGKSMLLNAIVGEERAIVSDRPGTTRDALDTLAEVNGVPLVIVDTAGIRRRGRVERGVERYSVLRAMRAIERAEIALLVLDAQEMLTAQDAHIAGYIWQAYKGLVVVVNKWDLAPELGLEEEACRRHIRSGLKFAPAAPIHFISATLGQGIEDVLASAQSVFSSRRQRIPTPTVNRVLQDALGSHAPPLVGNKRFKVFYATQDDVSPPGFTIFVNDPALLHFSYRRYLENRLRQAFGFLGTPLRLNFKRRSERER